MLKLYSYYRSSAAYRVRIALNLKALDWKAIPINLLNDEHQGTDYKRLNPQGLVPALDTGDSIISQSLAIIEYLDERYPEPALLPTEPRARAQVRSLTHSIAMDIHPLNNLRVIRYLSQRLSVEKAQELAWYQHWISEGFSALEAALNKQGSDKQGSQERYCWGDQPGLADICLIPQVYNARRFDCDLTPYPNLVSIDAHCRSLPAFKAAAPEAQTDCPQH